MQNAEIISIMFVNNETGFINDIKTLRSIYKDKIFHCDATQAIGNIKVNVKDLNIDTMSFSGHKFHAPKGIGVLYIREGLDIKPLIYGGKQENHLRGGTENILGISALGVAIKEATDNIEEKNNHCKKIKQMILKELDKAKIDYINNSQFENSINSTLSISIKNIESEPLIIQLALKDIFISSGSACNTGSLEPSETLKYLKIPEEYINGTIRISYNEYNSYESIKYFCDELISTIKRNQTFI